MKNIPAGDSPTISPDSWTKITKSFMGQNQLAKGNSQIIILQGDGSTDPTINLSFSVSGRANQKGLLNKWFGITSAPWIYIQNNDVLFLDTFLWGATPLGSSSFSRTDNPLYVNAWMPQTYTPSLTLNPDFTIKVPAALWATLGSSDDNRSKVVKQFADRFVIAGIFYDVQTYS